MRQWHRAVLSQNSESDMNSTASANSGTSPCIQAGGTTSSSGGCICPSGWTSPYDAYITGRFCTIFTEYSPVEGTGNSTGNTTTNRVPPQNVVGISGIIQSVIVFAISMLVVCVFRSLLTKCNRDSHDNSSALSRSQWPTAAGVLN